jgi:hypothetical protein
MSSIRKYLDIVENLKEWGGKKTPPPPPPPAAKPKSWAVRNGAAEQEANQARAPLLLSKLSQLAKSVRQGNDNHFSELFRVATELKKVYPQQVNLLNRLIQTARQHDSIDVLDRLLWNIKKELGGTV